MLKIQIVATDIDINSHNYHKIYTRNLRLGLAHGWHYMVRDLPLVFVLGLVSYFNSVTANGVVVSSTCTGNVMPRESPSGVQRQSPGRGPGGRSPPEAEEF